MSFTLLNKENKREVVYTDGYCFTDNFNPLPGINLSTALNTASTKTTDRVSFFLEEGIWWLPVDYRLCVYNTNEILQQSFLDITQRISVYKNTFILLEKEIEMEPVISSLEKEIYYDISFYNEETLLELLKEDIHLLDKGNLLFWKNKIELINLLYHS